jgi:hypothetical protein
MNRLILMTRWYYAQGYSKTDAVMRAVKRVMF